MNSSIKGIATATLVLLLNYSANPGFALPQKINHPITVAKSQPFTDTLIVPGERVGPITRTTTKQDLVKLFGASHLVDKTISGAEGMGSFAATEVNLNHRANASKLLLITTKVKNQRKNLSFRA